MPGTMAGPRYCLAIALLIVINHLSSCTIESAFESGGDDGWNRNRLQPQNQPQHQHQKNEDFRLRKPPSRQHYPLPLSPSQHNTVVIQPPYYKTKKTLPDTPRRKPIVKINTKNSRKRRDEGMLSASKATAAQHALDDASLEVGRAKVQKMSQNGERKAGKGPKNTLQLVTLMFRHGDRAPEPAEVSSFPNYEYANDTWYPVGAGHLTNNGKLRLYKLGKTVRARYGKFLGDLYTTDLATTFCTDFPRTKASAQMFHAGLWPPLGDQIWSDDESLASMWQPVPYNIDLKLNSAMNSFLRSPCFAYEFMRVLQLPEFQRLIRPHEKLLNLLIEKTGMKVDNPLHVWLVKSLFLAQEAMGKSKPDWAEDHWDEICAVSEIAFAALMYNDDLKRMAIGPILKRIVSDCQDKADGVLEPRQRKLIVYSGHDTTVGPLFAAMGGSEGYIDEDGNPLKTIVPSFGSAVILELHKIEGEYAVKILFNEKSQDGTFKELKLAGCGEFCPLDKYIEMTKNIADDDQGLDKCPEAKNSKSIFERAIKRRQ